MRFKIIRISYATLCIAQRQTNHTQTHLIYQHSQKFHHRLRPHGYMSHQHMGTDQSYKSLGVFLGSQKNRWILSHKQYNTYTSCLPMYIKQSIKELYGHSVVNRTDGYIKPQGNFTQFH